MESLVDETLLAHALPALAMASGLAAAVVAQCGKSRPQPVKQARKKPAGKHRSGRSHNSRKSGKVSKSGKSHRPKHRSSKSEKALKKSKSRHPSKSTKSGKFAKSRKSTKTAKSKSAPRKPGKSTKHRRSTSSKSSKRPNKSRSQSRSKTSDGSSKPKKVTQNLPPVVQQAPVQVGAPKKQEVKPVAADVQQQAVRQVAREAAKKDVQVQIDSGKKVHVEPIELRFLSSGGINKIHLTNPTSQLYAVKLKCSDNNLYRVNPVYSYIYPNQESDLDIVRQNGASKVDKLILVFAKATEGKVHPKEIINASKDLQHIVVPLIG